MRLRFSFVALIVSLVAMFATAASAAAAQPSYTALGDSYTAGDGTNVFYSPGMSYVSGHPCYQSPDAYPVRLAAGGRFNLTFAACSGATTTSMLTNQMGSLSPSTHLVTVQIGGNDIGFGLVVASCLQALQISPLTCSQALSYAEYMTEAVLPAKLEAAYTAIRADAPSAQVVVLGYPRLFDSQGTTCQPTLSMGMTSSEETAMNAGANMLDSVISNTAAAYGFQYVDPRQAFVHHEVCSQDPWINGAGLFATHEWFHPNISGETMFTSLIERQLH